MAAYIVTSLDIWAYAHRETQIDVPGEPPVLAPTTPRYIMLSRSEKLKAFDARRRSGCLLKRMSAKSVKKITSCTHPMDGLNAVDRQRPRSCRKTDTEDLSLWHETATARYELFRNLQQVKCALGGCERDAHPGNYRKWGAYQR